MKVKVKCDECNRQVKLKALSMKDVREIKRAVKCKCMKCMSTPTNNMFDVYGDTAVLVW